jgi:tetratricopeptide (TPR) repeat protein
MSMNRQERRRAERLAAKSGRKTPPGPPLPSAVEQAATLIDSGRSSDAEEILRALVAADATDVSALVLLSKALRLQQRLDEAVAFARRATVRDAMSSAAHSALGEALRAQDRVYEAMPSHERAIALAPDDAEAHHAYGLSLLEIGDLEASVSIFAPRPA